MCASLDCNWITNDEKWPNYCTLLLRLFTVSSPSHWHNILSFARTLTYTSLTYDLDSCAFVDASTISSHILGPSHLLTSTEDRPKFVNGSWISPLTATHQSLGTHNYILIAFVRAIHMGFIEFEMVISLYASRHGRWPNVARQCHGKQIWRSIRLNYIMKAFRPRRVHYIGRLWPSIFPILQQSHLATEIRCCWQFEPLGATFSDKQMIF